MAADELEEMMRARLIGTETIVNVTTPEKRRECWHCHGLKVCPCAFCLQVQAHGVHISGPCIACLGTGQLCGPKVILHTNANEEGPDRR